jgi:thiol peroxidase
MDLPFAQKRFCDAIKIQNVLTLSDYKDHAFGNTYGLLIKELGLLTRAVLVIDASGKITHFEIVKEVTEEPNYQAAIENVKGAKIAVS